MGSKRGQSSKSTQGMFDRARRRGTGDDTADGRPWYLKPSVLVTAGLVVAVVGIIGAGMYFGSGEANSNFEFEVYQGEDLLGGTEVNFTDVLGSGKPVVLNFCAGDCPPCRFEMPWFQRTYEEHNGDVLFLGLDTGKFSGLGTRSSAFALMEELDITYPIGAPYARAALDNYGVQGFPTTVFFDSDGKVSRKWDGAMFEPQLKEFVQEILAN